MKLTDNEHLRKIGVDHLTELFGEYSESRWCAGWHSGTENEVWTDATGPTPSDQAREILEIAELLGVWIHWPDESDDPVPIPLDEWKRKVGAV